MRGGAGRRPHPAGGAGGVDALDADPVTQVFADERALVAAGRTAHRRLVTRRGPLHDLGYVAAGTVVLDIDGAAPGTVLDLAGADLLDGRGGLADLGEHAGFRYVCQGGGPERFESSWAIGARHLSVRRPPAGLTTPARRRSLSRCTSACAPRPEGNLRLPDPDLEHIFAVGLRTVDLCAFDAYVDCPTRRATGVDGRRRRPPDGRPRRQPPDWSVARWHPQLTAVSGPTAWCRWRSPGLRLRGPHDDLTGRCTGSGRCTTSGATPPATASSSPLLPVAERTIRWFETSATPTACSTASPGGPPSTGASVYSVRLPSALNAPGPAWRTSPTSPAGSGNDGTAAWA